MHVDYVADTNAPRQSKWTRKGLLKRFDQMGTAKKFDKFRPEGEEIQLDDRRRGPKITKSEEELFVGPDEDEDFYEPTYDLGDLLEPAADHLVPSGLRTIPGTPLTNTQTTSTTA